MRQYTLDHGGKTYHNATVPDLSGHGVPAHLIAQTVKSAAQDQAAAFAETLRSRLATTQAGKLSAYRVKEEIAADPGSADPEELALLDREATARGMSQQDLLDLITSKATAYRRAALMVEALEAELENAIAAVSDDTADIEIAVFAALATAMEAAKSEAAAALSQINGD